MKRLTSIILSIALFVCSSMSVAAEELPPAVQEWLPQAIERLRGVGVPDEEITSFLESVLETSDVSGMSAEELNLWLDAIILSIQHPEMSQEELNEIVSQGYASQNSEEGAPDINWDYQADGQDEGDLQDEDSGSDDSAPVNDLTGYINSFGPDLAAYLDVSAVSHVLVDIGDSERASYFDYLYWLSDQTINVIAPQAVEKLLQIPAFKDGLDRGLLSRYMSLAVTYDPQTGYGAMVTGAPLGPDGKQNGSTEVPVCGSGYILRINLSENGPGIKEDDRGLWTLEDTLLHEMTHAFMNDYNRNGMFGTDRDGLRPLEKNEDGTPAHSEDGEEVMVNEFPVWFSEGTATTVEAGYAVRRQELLEFFGDTDDMDDIRNTLSDRDSMMYCLTLGNQTEAGLDAASLKDVGNAYNVGYVACMFLYSMAAEKLGLDPCPEGDGFSIDESALLGGMSDILERLNRGQSLDQIIAEISVDPETGVSRYENTKSFEEHFAQDSEDPGLCFWQHMMLAYESEIENPDEYIPAGSVLPGYENAREHYLDRERRESSACYEITANPQPDMDRINFPLSTVQPSRLALGGGKSISYDQDADQLTPEEAALRDVLNTGDEIRFVTLDM